MLEIPYNTLKSAAQDGRIPARKVGRDWFVFEDTVEFKVWLESYWAKVEKNKP